MIESLKGLLVAANSQSLVVEVGGVGYGVDVSLNTLDKLPAVGKELHLLVHTLVREDQLKLFGFAQHEEKEIFRTLISLNGVGPKLALALLSHLSAEEIITAARDANIELLKSVPGIGLRKAEKLLVEIKPKLERMGMKVEGATIDPKVTPLRSDVKIALENLGYKDKQLKPILDELEFDKTKDLTTLVRQALLKLRRDAPGAQALNSGMF